jgi:hypothetical protein
MAKKKKREKLSEEELELLDDSDSPVSPKKKNNTTVTEPEDDESDSEYSKVFKISHRHDSKMLKLIRSRGVSPLDILHGNKSFNLEDYVQPMESQVFGRVKKINRNKQLNWYEKSYDKVLSQNWLSAGIGGFPSDLRAKQIALHLFLNAVREYQARDPRKNTNRSLPYWHHVYGGFGDHIRDLKADFPSFLVVSNITIDCTHIKYEKVRDICTKYNNLNIPVVVVCAGIDPYTFFTTKLYYPMRWGLYVGNSTISI